MSAQQRIQRQLEEVLKTPGNDKCADCKASSPRWASINLGIFLCVTCASAHRKMGTHTSRVKSVTLDEWTREQVNTMKEIGNIRSNAIYNPGDRHPAPTTTGADERDSELSKYIRRKYELGAFKAGAAASLARAPVNSRAIAQQRGHPNTNSNAKLSPNPILNRELPALPRSPPARTSSRQASPARGKPPAGPWATTPGAGSLAPPSQRGPGGTSSSSSSTSPATAASALPPRSASSLSPAPAQAAPLIDIEGSSSSTRPLQITSASAGASANAVEAGYGGTRGQMIQPPRPGFAPAPSPGLPAMSPLALGQQAFFTPVSAQHTAQSNPWAAQQQQQMQMQQQAQMQLQLQMQAHQQMQVQMQPNMGGMGMNMGVGGGGGAGGGGGGAGVGAGSMGGMGMSPNGGGMGMNSGHGHGSMGGMGMGMGLGSMGMSMGGVGGYVPVQQQYQWR